MATCILSFLSLVDWFNQHNIKPMKQSNGRHCKNLFKTIKTLSYGNTERNKG